MNSHPPSLYSGFNLGTGERVIAYLAVAILALIFMTFGVGSTAILTAVVCGAMGFEWFRLATGEHDFDEPMVWSALGAAALPAFAAYAGGPAGGASVALLGAAFLLLLGPKKGPDVLNAALGVLVIGLAGVGFVALRDDPTHGLALAAGLVLVVAATEIGCGLFGEEAVEGDDPHEDTIGIRMKAVCAGLAFGVVAGLIVAAFYREGGIFTVILCSLLVSLSVMLAAVVAEHIRDWLGRSPSSTLFFKQGPVIEAFQGVVFASLSAGALVMLARLLST